MDGSQLKNLLETQFGSYLRDKSYNDAFTQSIKLLDQLSIKDYQANPDVFYLFLHALIIELFDRIAKLEARLN